MGRPQQTIHEMLDYIVGEMVEKGIFWPELEAEMEKLFIIRALRESQGSIQRASEIVGVHRNTLSKKIREHQIDRQLIRRQSRSGSPDSH